MILYLDTSALVKRFIDEIGTLEVVTILQEAQLTGTSIISKAEAIAAMSKGVRTGLLSSSLAKSSVQQFHYRWPQLIRIQITEALVTRAGIAAWDLALRGYDAVHLASAIIWQNSINKPVTFASFDKQLWIAAKQSDLRVFPEDLPRFLATAVST